MYLSLSQKEEEMTTTSDYTTVTIDTAFMPDSSFVEYLAYDAEGKKAYVQLGSGIYVYDGVSAEQFEALVDADSVGHAFHEFARVHGPYSEFFSHDDGLYYSYREQTLEATDEATDEADNVFTLVPGTVEQTQDDSLGSLFSDLLPSAEEIEEATLRRRREMALAAAAASVAGAKNPLSSSAVLARAEDFEGYLAGE